MLPVVPHQKPDDQWLLDAVQKGQPPKENCHLESGSEGNNGECPGLGTRLFIQYISLST